MSLPALSRANEYDDLLSSATAAFAFDSNLDDEKGGAGTYTGGFANYGQSTEHAFWGNMELTGAVGSGYVQASPTIPQGDMTVFTRFSATTQTSDSESSYRPVVFLGTDDQIGIVVYRSGTSDAGKIAIAVRENGTYRSSVAPLVVTDGAPHTATLVRSGNTATLYVDGTPQTAMGSLSVGTLAGVSLGGEIQRDARRLAGKLDDAVIAPGASTSGQISLFGAGGTTHPGAVGTGGFQVPYQRGPLRPRRADGFGGVKIDEPPPGDCHVKWLHTYWNDNGDGTFTLVENVELHDNSDDTKGIRSDFPSRRFGVDHITYRHHSFGVGQNKTVHDSWGTVVVRPSDFGFQNGENWWTSCDIDGDGINNSVDGDIDADGLPNSSDDDDDGDGIPDKDDPYPRGNPVCGGQDMDGDGVSNSDDVDIDGDGIPNHEDDDDDGDGIPDGQDPDANGNGVPDAEEGGDPPNQGGGNWWDPPGNGGPQLGWPIGDIDGDGIPNLIDGDADGDGIPNYGDDDADGDGTPDAEQPNPPGYGGPKPRPPYDPPVVIPPPPGPPEYDPPDYEPPSDPEAECDPCYYLAQIAIMLNYDSYDGEGEEPGELFPELEPPIPPTVALPNLTVDLPDFQGGAAGSWYIPVPIPGVGTSQYKFSTDISQMEGFYSELPPSVWTSLDTIRIALRLLMLIVIIVKAAVAFFHLLGS